MISSLEPLNPVKMSVPGPNIASLLRQTSARDFNGDEAARLTAIKEAQRLVNRLQLPAERGWELAMENWVVLGALQTFIDLGLFERWNDAGGGQVSVEDLCRLANADVDPKLLGGYRGLLSHHPYPALVPLVLPCNSRRIVLHNAVY